MAGRPRMVERDRFLSHVDKTDSCWNWSGCTMPNGYGQFRLPKSHELAHRASYRLFVGPVPDGLSVLHRCDNRACVNPTHLFVGTQKENMLDAKAKGRTCKGESVKQSKLTEADVLAIRSAEGMQKEIAKRYGIRQGHVSRIKNGARWSHLTAMEAQNR